MNHIPEISVAILGYKSENFLYTFHQRVVDVLEKANLTYEIIIVANYIPNTGDTTPEVARDVAKISLHTKTVILEKPDNRHAMGWDARSGLNAATGDIIAFIDGDGQMPPEDILKLFYKIKNENLDICKATRILRGDGFYRKLTSFIFNKLIRLLFPGINSKDINGKPKIFTRNAYSKLELESNDWFIDSEIMIKARRYNFKIGEIDTIFYKNTVCNSSISFKTNFEFIKNLFWWRIKEFFI